MKFSGHWLRQWAPTTLSDQALADCLTMAGLEVEGVQAVAPPFSSVVVARVLSVEPHPGADRLKVCSVDVGQALPLRIVCGAPNVAIGMVTACATPGARLPGKNIPEKNVPGKNIEVSPVRGVESQGMLCSAQELGLSDASTGLWELPADTLPGSDVRTTFDLDDTVFTLKLTPNRGDCLSLRGLAREVAALTATALNPVPASVVSASLAERLPVTVSATLACPRYCGRIVRGVNGHATAPAWLTRRLERGGLRSVNALVDVTNYVLLELGQPLHAFDLDAIRGGLQVRWAQAGERLTLLNADEVELDGDTLVIADDSGALAVAGVMGGAGSAVSGATESVFIESAFFSPTAVAGRARRLGLESDSSHRFERGVDFAATREALERATALLLEIFPDARAGEVTEVTSTLPARDPIALSAIRTNRLLGVGLSPEDMRACLDRLGFIVTPRPDGFEVIPPSYRFDVSLDVDLVEEIARIHGYDRIPARRPRSHAAMLPAPERRRSTVDLKRLLAARGYQEVITYSFIDESAARDFAAGETLAGLQNPLSAQLAVLRPRLAPGLLGCLRHNLARQQERVWVFETGRRFSGADGQAQPQALAGLCHGSRDPRQWVGTPGPADFYDAKADVEALLHPHTADFTAHSLPWLHPGRAAEITCQGRVLGWIGALHPSLVKAYELPHPPILFELDLEPLLERRLPAFQAVPRFPAVRRDLALVVRESLPAAELLKAINDSPLVTEAAVFDTYRGPGVPGGHKSVALRLILQDPRKTLTEEEIEASVQALVRSLEATFEATLRT